MEEDDERTIELSSIAAIFPELVIDDTKPFSATLDVPVAPEKPLKIYFQSSTQSAPPSLLNLRTNATSGSNDEIKAAQVGSLGPALNVEAHQLSHLPPIKLEIVLPDGYPRDKPPDITVRADPPWLPQKTLGSIRDKCTELWKECGQDQVVYTFIDYAQQEAENAFGLADNTDHKFELSSDLKLILLDYDLKRKQEQFHNETFDCGVCLEPKKGKICHRMLLCGHVFCVACLQDFYNNCITEGDIDSVKCLHPGCGKDLAGNVSPGKKHRIDITLNPSELLQIPIEQNLVQRYVKLKRKKKLEADKNTIYCPRQWCQGAAKSKRHPKSDDPLQEADEPEDEPAIVTEKEAKKKKKKNIEDDIPMSERLSVCEDCNYAFCCVCKKGWHGELAYCNPRRTAELDEEEKASLEYLKLYSRPCPTCNAPAQKSYGCNHMICFKCKTHFCYLCGAYLMPDNPFRHFNDFKSNCHMRLFELEAGHGADVEVNRAGGNPPPWEAEDPDETDSEDESSEEDMNDFNGDRPAAWDDSSEDESPAPDQRRANRPHIEIVNFARNGANRRIEVGGPARPGPPPAVPDAPRNRHRPGNQRGRVAAQVQARPANAAAIQAALPHQARDGAQVDGNAVIPPPVLAAPGQGNNPDVGLQRFLQLALEDREDEWDSDEEGNDNDNEQIAQRQQIRARARNRGRWY